MHLFIGMNMEHMGHLGPYGKGIINHERIELIWGWVKTLVPSEPQNSW
jgi:hypothetical protein